MKSGGAAIWKLAGYSLQQPIIRIYHGKVIFLDRDGTLNVEVNYLHRKEDLVLLPGVPEALKAFKDQGYKLVVITNQAGVARGYYTEDDVRELHRYMNELLAEQGAEIDGFYYCPHHPEHGIGKYKIQCHCRKPETGMFEMAEQDFDVDKASSWMIGDKLIDIEADAITESAPCWWEPATAPESTKNRKEGRLPLRSVRK